MKLRGIGVIGLGYVGLPLARLIAASKTEIIGIENNNERVALLRSVESFPISADLAAVQSKKIVIICVPTPVHEDKSPDLTILNTLLESLSPFLQKGQLVIIESTVYPGYCRNIGVEKLESNSSLRIGDDVMLAHCPERINPGDSIWSLSTIPRVVGGYDKKSTDQAAAFYASILESSIHPMKSIEEAEAVKVVENTFRDINIAYVNELAITFNKIGIDLVNVIDGAATKPFGFLAHYPSIGVGGHCIPVDPYYLIDAAKNAGAENSFVAMARNLNDRMPSYLVSKLEAALATHKIDRAKVTVLGLTYKADIDDTRESPSLKFVEILKSNKHIVTTYDPYAPSLSTAKTVDEAISESDVIVIATHHAAFNSLDYKKIADDGTIIIVDGHDKLNGSAIKALGLSYIGVGRISS
ncbi:MAG: nucleotide sugar dehydrogenase [Candidatus Saccharibacteria bacterium]|nr:nucleotide sugar dehydrogenase [Candidatus Saccharibacteria bacterium]